uniref:Retroviral polymerase SH3-like domain-containing protein n=1 Tax=Chenopodium quinoa TaxID=63459 RepID=A0A803LQW7_CHEQI
MGYPFGKKGWRVFDLTTKEFFVSRDVKFIEEVFPFGNLEAVNISNNEYEDHNIHEDFSAIIYEDVVDPHHKAQSHTQDPAAGQASPRSAVPLADQPTVAAGEPAGNPAPDGPPIAFPTFTPFEQKLPPGPPPLPISGDLFSLGSMPHVSLTKLAKEYGPLMMLQLGQVPTVIISSAAVAKEALQKNDVCFSSRHILDAVRALKHHENSVAWLPAGSASSEWRNLRKICNSHVFSASRLGASQSLRRNKINDLIFYVEKSSDDGTAVNIGQAAFTTTLNLLSNTFFSVDMGDPNSEIAREFRETIRGLMEEVGKPNFADYFPFLQKIDLQGIRQRTSVHFGKLIDFFKIMINQRLQGERPSGSIEGNDVLDALLGINHEKNEKIELSIIPYLLLDLFSAGTDTTSTTLEWAMAELLHNPGKLKKAQMELQEIIGKGNSLAETDTPRLPYLQAIVKETLRMHPPVPLLLPKKADADVQLFGFNVPKNAQVLINAWAIGRDPTLWENPTLFEPERFMGSNIDFKGHDFELIPFGAGRRICPGLPLANRMIPLMLGSLIHGFDWKLENGISPDEMDMEESFGLTVEKAQRLCAIPLGRVPTVIISSAAMAKEALQKNDISFSNRMVVDGVRALGHHEKSIVWLPVAPQWRNLRKICNTHVFSSSRLDASQSLRRNKVKDLLKFVEKSSQLDEAVDIGQAAFTTTLNLLASTFFSVDLGDPSSDFACKFKKTTRDMIEDLGKPNIADYFPILQSIDPQGIRRQVNQEKTMEIEPSNIPNLLLDLFAGGTDTTSSTLEWAMAELLHNPEKLKKAKAELYEIIGQGNQIQEPDIVRLPYLQAVLKETFRLHPAVPFLIPRKVDSDVKLSSFTVPKNAQVLINVWAIGRDPDVWENPNSFEPERFLGSQIDIKGNDFELIPFGAGRQICPGLPLAIRMLHLMLGSLVNGFDWKVEGEISPEMMDMEEKFGITLQKA